MLRFIIMTTILFAFVTVQSGSPLFAQRPPDLPLQPEIEKLIAQLGNRDYAKREAASRELRLIGIVAKPTILKAKERSADPEIVARCERLLPAINLDFCWAKASQIIGNTPAARSLFLEMYVTESDLWYTFAEGSSNLGKQYSTRCNELLTGPTRNRLGVPAAPVDVSRYEFQEARLATLLLIGAECRKQIPNDSLLLVTQFFRQKWGGQYAKNTPPLLRKAYVTWAQEIASLPIEYDGNQKLELARKLLRSASATAGERQYALLTVARAKEKQDDELIRGFLSDETVCDTLFRKGIKTQVQLRDIALAAIIYRAGKDPMRFGFTNLQTDPELLFRPSSLGFSGIDSRIAAFKSWEEATSMSR